MAGMFELPQAKRVRREDLRSGSSSPSPTPDPEDRQDVAERLNAVFGSLDYEEIQASITDNVATGSVEEEENNGLEFRLFARPANSATTDASTGPEKPVARIRLGSEEDPDRPAGFIIPHRPQTYYFRPLPTPKDLAHLRAAAIDATLIHKLSHIPWPGTAIPWRVTHHTLSPKQVRALTNPRGTTMTTSSSLLDDHDDKPTKRRRKGKKARILIRKKTASVRIRKELDAMNEQQRQEVEREKRAKNNRKKQLKKREKARAAKAAVEVEEGERGQDESRGGGDDGQAGKADAMDVS